MNKFIVSVFVIPFIAIASCSNSRDTEARINDYIKNGKFDSALVLAEANKSNLQPCNYARYVFQASQKIDNADSLVLSTKSIISKCNVSNDSLYPVYASAYFGISKKYSYIDSVQEAKWLEKAKDEASKCINENPNNVECYKIGAKSLHNLHSAPEELRWIIPAYKKWPNDPEIQAFYGVALMMSNDYSSAKEILANCFRCISDSDPNRKICAAGLRFRGVMFDELGIPDSALSNLNASWRANPIDYNTAAALGRIWMEKHNTDSACKYRREGLKLGDVREKDWIKMKCNQ